MRRFAGGFFAMLLLLSSCATEASGPRLSQASVRRIADAEVRRVMKANPSEYVSEPHYNAKGHYWSVIYRFKTNKRVAFRVRVSDQIQNASINRDDGGVFEGALIEKPDNH